MRISCAFATSLDSHEHARIAENLGYERAFFYDSPALYPDVWVQLCRAAERTERITLGPGVLIPSLRHPMVTASAIATLVSVAGAERTMVGVGSGFTGRLSMGKRPLPWAKVKEYVLVVSALLRGEEVEWDGGIMKMLAPDDRYAPARPIEVPWVVAANGPKGYGVTRDLGAEVLTVLVPNADLASSVILDFGTVLEDGEDPGSARVVDAAGHGLSVVLHWAVEHGVIDELLPERGSEWAAAYDDIPKERRHLALHDRHLVAVNELDRPFVTGELMVKGGLALSPSEWRDKLAKLEAAGSTEIAYQPAGPDIPRELEAFAAAARA
ncbi:LLM class flavin-dependent oxidoreductase [Pseudonocardia kujensis]|uniref:LLM class flavin-dependent oxidoreductase n=1 Tax=Pseudonocardia kujensis TaxID=1128675 RepID=UPI001E293110|nr:LLM class flavin-dependent oxidoreductase [Pseudonocardia kujensis]MCE0761732.1 LLM class flavin-dependent oxidoreductase [Pseudonocardia kujensis]